MHCVGISSDVQSLFDMIDSNVLKREVANFELGRLLMGITVYFVEG